MTRKIKYKGYIIALNNKVKRVQIDGVVQTFVTLTKAKEYIDEKVKDV